MDLDGRRESENYEDRRGMSGGAVTGMGLGGIILFALIFLLSGKFDLGSLGDIMSAGNDTQEVTEGDANGQRQREINPEEEKQVKFCKQILASTEDVWSAVFRQKYNREYQPPKIVFFTNSVQTSCGGATSAVGPFYCSADQKLYIDLSFFKQMENELGARGEFARAYVIAHEVGHHVEYLLGSLGKAHAQMQQSSKAKANQISVRLELLADYYAGVWAHYEGEAYSSISDKDIESAINCAQKIGDDILTQGRVSPESFTHGTAKQRMRWLKRGMQTGDMNTTTFNVDYNSL